MGNICCSEKEAFALEAIDASQKAPERKAPVMQGVSRVDHEFFEDDSDEEECEYKVLSRCSNTNAASDCIPLNQNVVVPE